MATIYRQGEFRSPRHGYINFNEDLVLPILKQQAVVWDQVFKLVFTVHLGYTYMPDLTLCDKISQNLAQLEANSHKIFKSHRIFRPSHSTFYEEINTNHTLLCLSQASYI